MPCLQEQNADKAAPGHGAWKLPAVLPEMQAGNANQRKGATYHSYHRAERKKDIMTIQFPILDLNNSQFVYCYCSLTRISYYMDCFKEGRHVWLYDGAGSREAMGTIGTPRSEAMRGKAHWRGCSSAPRMVNPQRRRETKRSAKKKLTFSKTIFGGSNNNG